MQPNEEELLCIILAILFLSFCFLLGALVRVFLRKMHPGVPALLASLPVFCNFACSVAYLGRSSEPLALFSMGALVVVLAFLLARLGVVVVDKTGKT